jgi:autotransporter-associated beta strand protein
MAQTLPPPVTTINSFPPPNHAYLTNMRFGPDGLIYAWDGQNVWRQSGVNVDSFGATPFGTVPTTDSDAGPINFSQDGRTLLIGNGSGGNDFSGPSNGQLFTMPATGGPATLVGTVPNHFDLIPLPVASTVPNFRAKVLLDVGTPNFHSEVDVFNMASGKAAAVVRNIPGASSSIALDSANRLYVGIGYGDSRGQIRRFSLPLIDAAADGQPIDWSSGQLFNAADNNSGGGMFFDARGNFFVGGPDGVAVFNKNGASQVYNTGAGSNPAVSYNPTNDQFAMYLIGFNDPQGLGFKPLIYNASAFNAPAAPISAWNLATGGNWSNGANWNSSTAPNGIDQRALLGGAMAPPRTIVLDAPNTLGALMINSPQKYLVSGSNVLTMQVSTAIATIDVATGSHEIAAPLALASDTDVTVTNATDMLTLSGGVAGSGMLSKEGNGTLTISAANNYSGNTAVDGGKLRFQIATGSASVANGATVTVAAGATLELAGAVSALGTPGGNRAHVINDSSAQGLLVTGTNQVVGGIDGAGTASISAGGDLMADHIIQSALVIGGDATAHGVLTIAPSDADGNSLILTSLHAPNAPFDADGESGLNAATIDAAAIPGSARLVGESALAPTAVPEPAALSLAAIAAMLVAAASSRRARE